MMQIKPDVKHELEYMTQLHSNGLVTSFLKLKLVVQKDHFRNGVLKLKCIATIANGYRVAHETELHVLQQKEKLADSGGSASLSSSSSSSSSSQAAGDHHHHQGEKHDHNIGNNKKVRKESSGNIGDNMSEAGEHLVVQAIIRLLSFFPAVLHDQL